MLRVTTFADVRARTRPKGFRARCRGAVATVAVVLAAAGCQPIATGQPVAAGSGGLAPAAAYADRPLAPYAPSLSLVGDPDATLAGLSADARGWSDRLWIAIAASRDAMEERAVRGDAYDIGRWLYQYQAALLLGLRATGDLRFLDEVDVVTEALRRELSDSWCGGVASRVDVNIRYGTVVEPDGHRNFRLLTGGGRDRCRDTGDLNEALVHGHLAMVMYAYHANRGLESPAGVDYGERADFWLRYLRDDFEAKWRGRSDVAWPSMDFIDLKFCHTYTQMILFHHFVGQRLREDGSSEAGPYLREVARLTDGMFDVPYVAGRHPGGFQEVDTPEGRALVYSFGAPGFEDAESRTSFEACGVTYARYLATSALVLRLEGVDRWTDDVLSGLANGLAHFAFDTEPVRSARFPVAAGVTGSARVAGIPATRVVGRMPADQLVISPFAAYGAWNATGKVERVLLEAYELVEPDVERPEQVFVPAGMLLASVFGAPER